MFPILAAGSSEDRESNGIRTVTKSLDHPVNLDRGVFYYLHNVSASIYHLHRMYGSGHYPNRYDAGFVACAAVVHPSFRRLHISQ